MRLLFVCLVCILVSVCRYALGADTSEGVSAFPIGRLFDYGALGAFTIYLILDHRRRDKREADRDKKEAKTAERFEALDMRIIVVTESSTTVIKDATVAMNVMSVAANELKNSVGELKNVLYTKPCLRPNGAKTRESDRL